MLDALGQVDRLYFPRPVSATGKMTLPSHTVRLGEFVLQIINDAPGFLEIVRILLFFPLCLGCFQALSLT